MTSVDLLTMLIPLQSRMLLASFAVRVQCWLVLNLSARTPRRFSAEPLPSQEASAQPVLLHGVILVQVQGFELQEVPLSPLHRPVKVLRHDHMVHQTLLIWYGLQDCWECTPSITFRISAEGFNLLRVLQALTGLQLAFVLLITTP